MRTSDRIGRRLSGSLLFHEEITSASMIVTPPPPPSLEGVMY